MPAWWGKRSSKSKERDGNIESPVKGSSFRNGKVKNDENCNKKGSKSKSFDEFAGLHQQAINSPRSSRDFGSSGFSGFDSPSSSVDRGHPLPRPSEPASDHGHAHGAGLGSGSGSVSSVSSSGSSDDHSHADQAAVRGRGEKRLSNRLSPLSRSPGGGVRGVPATTSPLHARSSNNNLDSPTEGHLLPRPPSSPTSPSALPNPRSPGKSGSTTGAVPKWRKGRLLGKGTFGHVYLGFNSQNGQMCAIKEVKVVSDDSSSKECLKQLNQEIVLLSQLSHPNIVQYYGSDLSEETLSVYLEYVSGGSIHKLLQEYGPFGEPVIQNYTRQILSGLSYLHGRNTVHRDIKGANILVDPNGEIKLADFGMAKHITSCSSMLSFKGSPYWMAPEVVMNTNGYSLPVDIWSLGCTILEMATSKPPWGHYEGVAAIFKIGNSKEIPQIPDHLSNDAKSFIRMCLQRDPSTRPTASQLLKHPFIWNQTTQRSADISVLREASHAFDGSRPPMTMEPHSSRVSNSSMVRDASKPTVSRTIMSPRESARIITSLPVSPSSSPLRNHVPAHGFVSPPHLSYPFMGQSNNNHSNYSVFPISPAMRSPYDPMLDLPQFRALMSNKSPNRTVP